MLATDVRASATFRSPVLSSIETGSALASLLVLLQLRRKAPVSSFFPSSSFSVRRRTVTFSLITGLLVAPVMLGVHASAAVARETTSSHAGAHAGGNEVASATTDFSDSKVGDLISVRIGEVRPTQPSVGYDEIYYKLGRYDAALSKDAVNKRFGDWCEANGQLDVKAAQPNATLQDPSSFECELALGSETDQSIAEMKTVVVGPRGVAYLTDGHHTLTSFAEASDGGPNTQIRLRVAANLSAENDDQFWATMKANKWTWLERPDGASITPAELPTTIRLKAFLDDPNRSLLYFARDIGFKAGSIPFQEFYWGSWLRDTKPAFLDAWDRGNSASYLATVRSLTESQTQLKKNDVVYSGFTAEALGRLSKWNDGKKEDKGEWSKLSQSYDAAKPGKIAYAMKYKELLAATPGGETETPTSPGTDTPEAPQTILGSLSVSGSVAPGASVTVHGTGFAPSTQGFSLELHSDPIQLAVVQTDAKGEFSQQVTLPADFVGSHHVVLLINGTVVGSLEISGQAPVTTPSAEGAQGSPVSKADAASPATLPRTGSNAEWPLFTLGAVLLVAGACLLAPRLRARLDT